MLQFKAMCSKGLSVAQLHSNGNNYNLCLSSVFLYRIHTTETHSKVNHFQLYRTTLGAIHAVVHMSEQ